MKVCNFSLLLVVLRLVSISWASISMNKLNWCHRNGNHKKNSPPPLPLFWLFLNHKPLSFIDRLDSSVKVSWFWIKGYCQLSVWLVWKSMFFSKRVRECIHLSWLIWKYIVKSLNFLPKKEDWKLLLVYLYCCC